MRQAGSLAAAGIYALDNHIERLKEDHTKALEIKNTLLKKDFVKEIFEVETNIVIAHIEGKYNATQLAAALKEKNILVIAMTPALIRFVVHRILLLTPHPGRVRAELGSTGIDVVGQGGQTLSSRIEKLLFEERPIHRSSANG